VRKKLSRRDFLKVTTAAGTDIILTSCSGKDSGELTFFDRVLGCPLTDLPQVESAWSYKNHTLRLDLAKLPELDAMGGAVRIEGEALPEDVLIVYGLDGSYYALKNACTHADRKIDPVADTMTLESCSVSSSTFDYQGNVLSGPAEGSLTSFALSVDGELIEITF
jgi:nitrite reductase/ring-hydroxylating ferredoxin subunit